jgi:hypothetical protein
MPACLAIVMAALALAQAAPPPKAYPEVAVSATLEELRKGELMLDADALAPHIAASLTVIEGGDRISGSFAFLEPIRRLRERSVEVRELRFDHLVVRVYGASAITSYRYTKVWNESGARHRQEGWSSDVFELRDDGAWILVHRQRSR